MLAEIGIMIGFYILTRMLSLERKKDGTPSVFTRAFAVVTFLVTCFVIVDLILRGLSADNNIPTL